ncbi:MULTISPECIES: PQQ-binding-like beta-propeller repeat protein [unclassified Streptomyces]|uniref:outer membrane protein assembly factor BamB family protein n=1 Tax=unclassified Streptomyces TaxID=2593676 RepID=UPI00278C7DD6|nr:MULTISPECIES: PQQ-binding-like beta-propeller repeat protein [unclassified Streptomyces]
MTQPPNWPPRGGFDRHIPLPPEQPPTPVQGPPQQQPADDGDGRPGAFGGTGTGTGTSSGSGTSSGTGTGAKLSPRSPLVLIAAGVVALALVVGGVTYLSTSGGDDPGAGAAGPADGDKSDGIDGPAAERPPADPAARPSLRLPAPKVAKRQVDSVRGSWLIDGTYAKAGVNQIAGYDAATGRKTWTLPLSGQTCAGTAGVTDDGLAAVVSEAGKRAKNHRPRPCTQITVFDVNTGDKLWTKTVRQGTKDRRFEELSLSGNTLAAGGGFDGGAAFDIKSGRILWQPDTGACEDVGYRGGARLVAVRKCGAYGKETYDVQLLDPTTGGPKWSYKLPAGSADVKVLSTRPVVFGVGTGHDAARTINDILTVDDNGKLTSKIAIDHKKYDFTCEVGKTEGCAKLTVGNGRVYLATRQHAVSGRSKSAARTSGTTNEIVSYSLETGKPTGDRVEGGDHDIFPLRMDGGHLLAFKTGAYDKGSEVATIDPRTMKQRTLLETPATATVRNAISGMAPGEAGAELHYAKGNLFIGRSVIGAPYADDGARYTALGFTTD